jgi:hypothetical protein
MTKEKLIKSLLGLGQPEVEVEDTEKLEVSISSTGVSSVDPDSLMATKAVRDQLDAASRLEKLSKNHKAA